MALLQDFVLLDVVCPVLVSVILILVLRWFFREPKALPPGPRGYPLVGSIPAFAWEIWRGMEPYQILQKYAAKYGPVFRLKFFTKTVVILNDFASMKEVFMHPNMQDRPHMKVLLDAMRGSGVISSSGEPWMELRRLSVNIFKHLGVGKSSYEGKIATEAEELIKEFSASDGRPFDPNHLLCNGVSNVICSVLFGKRFQYSDKEFKQILHCMSRNAELIGAGGAILFFPWLRHLPVFAAKEMVSNFKEIGKFLTDIVDIHRSSFDANNLITDFTDALLLQMEPHTANTNAGTSLTNGNSSTSVYRHDELSLIGTLADMLLAGTLSPASILQWGLLYMAVYPDIQKRVHEEIDAVVGRNRLPRMSDKPELNFTQAVIFEIQRLGNVLPIGVAHIAASDTEFGGFLIQRGSVIVSNVVSLFQDPTIWPEPEEMKPERFLDDEGKVVKVEELIPFGIGRRSCIGDNLAKMELFIFFSYFLHQFTFKKPDNSPPLSLKGTTGISNQPLPFEICAVRRD